MYFIFICCETIILYIVKEGRVFRYNFQTLPALEQSAEHALGYEPALESFSVLTGYIAYSLNRVHGLHFPLKLWQEDIPICHGK